MSGLPVFRRHRPLPDSFAMLTHYAERLMIGPRKKSRHALSRARRVFYPKCTPSSSLIGQSACPDLARLNWGRRALLACCTELFGGADKAWLSAYCMAKCETTETAAACQLNGNAGRRLWRSNLVSKSVSKTQTTAPIKQLSRGRGYDYSAKAGELVGRR